MTPEEAAEAQQARIAEIVEAEVTRRRFLEWASKAGMGGIALSTVGGSFLAACAKGSSSKASPGTGSSGTSGSNDKIKVGVVAPFSGLGAFIGKIVTRSTNAAVAQLNATGGIGGRKVELVLRDTGVDAGNGPKAYNQLVAEGVVGILWCFGAGFNPNTLPLIKRDGMPVISVFNDLSSTNKLYPGGNDAGQSVFQLSDDGKQASAVAMEYAATDRGYKSVALIYDTDLDPQGDGKKVFLETAQAAGLRVTGVETFHISDSEYGSQLRRFKAQKPECLFIGGLSGNTAGIVKGLADLNASYIDTPTAKAGGDWHPQIIGSAGGTGDKSWVELAGPAAKVGTNTVWHVSGLIGNPGFPITQWAQKYQHETVTGGEEVPADGLAALLYGIKKAGSTDRAKMVQGMETMGKIKFASIEFDFTKDRHVAHTKDDLVMITMERGGTGPAPTDPAYKLGVEWSKGHIFENTSAGPTHLVRPTLEGNKRAHPDLMKQILDGNYGTQCTKHADGTLGKECKIH